MTRHTQQPRPVYFIRPIGMQGPIKIGCSFIPDNRRRALETWCPFPLEIVAQLLGNMEIERRFHYRFRDQCKGREWFEWSPDLQATMDAIAAGTFDISSLPEAQKLPKPYQRNLTRFRDPVWRFGRSICSRLDGARKRGAGRAYIESWLGMGEHTLVGMMLHDRALVPSLGARAVALLNDIDERFPPKRKRPPLSIPSACFTGSWQAAGRALAPTHGTASGHDFARRG